MPSGICSLPATERMKVGGSTIRHFTNVSIIRLSFSDVMKRSLSDVSIVRMRLSKYRTFWNGGGSLKYNPGVSMTRRISPSA